MCQDEKFWEKWWEAHELNKDLLIDKLPIAGGKNKPTASLLNSYFVDLKEYAERRMSLPSVETLEGMVWDANRYYHDNDECDSYSMFIAEWIFDSIKQNLYPEEENE